MRQGQQSHHHNNKRMRGRSNNNNRKGPNPLTRSYESNGGDVKIRGTALHIAEKYVQLARDSQSSGDRVAAENYLQHAEHYYRLVAAAQAQMPQPQPVYRSDDDNEDDEERSDRGQGFGGPQQGGGQPQQGGEQTPFGSQEGQPFANGNGQGGFDDDMPRQGGSGEQPNQNQPRFDNRGGGGQEFRGEQRGDRGDFRGRRRRPFRERYQEGGGQSGGQRNDAPDTGPAPPEYSPHDD
jgi:hypothetical protein